MSIKNLEVVRNDSFVDESNNVSLKFENCFESFVQANSSKLICKCFDNICKSLKINSKLIFENGHLIQSNSYNNFNHKRVSQTSTSSSFQSRTQKNAQFSNTTQQYTHLIYKIIKTKTQDWKANELFSRYDKKENFKDYARNSNNYKKLNVLIIGCGPVGLRLSIECALLGHKCTIVEKRDKFSRNNVLHLWPYTINDLKNLGAKLFYGKFCAGSIDHISIRKLQCILLKAALLFGVRVCFNTSFEEVIEPEIDSDGKNTCWRAKFLPESCQLAAESFDVIIGADGRRNTLPGFKRKEFRGRLAIGITANFINYNSAEEAEVQERSGVAFIFDQKFFLDLKEETGIDLENIVYYKDDTHYFVMTAKRQSLIEKGVIIHDHSDATQLLEKENVNFTKLCDYAKEAAYVSTNKKLRTLNFAKNHYGQPDVAMFDFTSLFQSENASRIVERKGKKLFMALVGDSLLEPFWPLGTGIARGFLAAFDTAWAIKRFANDVDPIKLLVERESIYQLLSQTTHDNLNKNFQEYTINPMSRYLNLKMLVESQVRHLYDNGTNRLVENHPLQVANGYVQSKTLLRWCQIIVQPYNLCIENFTTSWKDGRAFCAIINRFRPDLIDYNSVVSSNSSENIERVFNLIRVMLGLRLEVTVEEFENSSGPDKITVLMILDKLYGLFRNQELIDADYENTLEKTDHPINNKRKILHEEAPVQRYILKPNRKKEESEDNKLNSLKTNTSLKNINVNVNVNDIANMFKSRIENTNNQDYKNYNFPTSNSNAVELISSNIAQKSKTCYLCDKRVYLMERFVVMDLPIHANCFRCTYCSRTLRNSPYSYLKDPVTLKYVFYCVNHVGMTNKKLSSNSQKRKSFLQFDSTPSSIDFKKITVNKIFNKTPERAEFESEIEFGKYLNNQYKEKKISMNQLVENKNIEDEEDDDNNQFESEDYYDEENEEEEESEVDDEEDDDEEDDEEEDEDEEVDEEEEEEDGDEDEEDEEDQNEDEGDVDYDDSEIEGEDTDEETIKVKMKEYNVKHDVDDLKGYKIDKNNEEINKQKFKETEFSKKDFQNQNNVKSFDAFKNVFTNKIIEQLIETDNLSDDKWKYENEFQNNNNKNELKKEKKHIFNKNEEKSDLVKSSLEDKLEIVNDQKLGTHQNLNRGSNHNEISSSELLTNILLNKRSNVICNICNKPSHITERVKLQGLVFHHDCIKCCVCDRNVRNAESFTRRTTDDKIFFYCTQHAPEKSIGDNLSIRHIDLEEKHNSDEVYFNKNPKKMSQLEKTYKKFVDNYLSDNSIEGEDDDDDFESSIWSAHNENFITKRKKKEAKLILKQKDLSKSKSESPISTILTTSSSTGSCSVSSNSVSNNSDKKYNNLKEKLDEKYDLFEESSKYLNKKDKNNFDTLVETGLSKEQKIILDCDLIRKNALEKAKMKSDEELGLKLNIPENIKRMIMPTLDLNSKSDTNNFNRCDQNNKSNLENEIEHKRKLVERPVEKLSFKNINKSKKENDSDCSSDCISVENEFFDEKIENEQDLRKKMNILKQTSAAPLAQLETFEDFNETSIDTLDNNNKYKEFNILKNVEEFFNFEDYEVKNKLNNILEMSKNQVKNSKIKIAKFLLPNSSSKSPTSSLHRNNNDYSLNKSSPAKNKASFLNFTDSKNLAVLKDFNDFNCKNSVVNSNSNSSQLNNSCSSSSSDVNKSQHHSESLAGSFNALNVNNSPRISRSKMFKLNYKRHKNEEKKIEKQRKDKRLRMSQEIQRKLEEIETKLIELEKSGVELEKTISEMDDNDLSLLENKEKLEHELYNIIHEKNLLTRVEHDLNIQGSALAIEDKLSELQQQLRETLNTPETEKSFEIISEERKLMENIVELVEKKNKLVEQLEALRIMEREEDNEITRIFSAKNILDPNTEIVNKYERFHDII